MPAEAPTAPAHTEQLRPGSFVTDLPPETLSQLSAELGLPVETFGGKAEPTAPSAAEKLAAEKAQADAAAKAKTEAEAKEEELRKAGTEQTKPVEFTPEQTAWLEQRAAAATPEAAAELDKTAPQFTDAQWAEIEKGVGSSESGVAPAATPVELTAEVKAELDRQLAAERAETTKFRTEAEAQSKRVNELTAQVTQLQTQPVSVANVHPLLTADLPALAAAEAEAQRVKAWALANWDGTSEVPANGSQPAQPAYTPEQVRKAYAKADEALTLLIPTGRQHHAEFEAANAATRAIYPELFTASPEAQSAQVILRRMPALKAVLPNISTIMGDAIVGEKIRAALSGDKPTAATVALAQALVAADPGLAKFFPRLTQVTAPGPVGMRLPKKPLVPLARPAPTGGARSVPNGKASAAPSLKKLAAASNTAAEGEALTEVVAGLLHTIPTVKPEDAR